MGLEAQNLAQKMNDFNLASERATEKSVYEEGKRQYHNILLNMRFVTDEGLLNVRHYLNENGLRVYERYFKKVIEKPKK